MENEVMTQVLFFSTIIAAVVTSAMEMIKRTTMIPAKWIPAVSFFVGLAIGVAAYPFTDMNLVLRLWSGGIAGWMASGIYETVKQTKKL